MKTPSKTTIAAALAIGLLAASGSVFAADQAPAQPTPPYGPGNCPMAQQGGPGGPGFGPGKMMKGRGMGMGGPAYMQQTNVDRNLNVDQVREYFESRIKWHGNDRLKVGNVTTKDADTITVEIVTVDNSLVNKFDLDRHTGWRK